MTKRRARSVVADSKQDHAPSRRATGRTLPQMGAAELRHFKISKDLLEKQLTDPVGTLIKELTGLQLHVLWHEPFDAQRPGRTLKLCPGSNSASPHRVGPQAACIGCLEENWKPSVEPFGTGSRFVGSCGVTTFRVGIQTGTRASPLTLALQAHVSEERSRSRGTVPSTKFDQAVALLQMLKRDLEMALRAANAELALKRLHRRLPVLRKEAQLVQVVRQSDALDEPVLPGRSSHAQRIVQRMISHVHEHFHRPMSLTQVASAIGMNASYLSDLFSRQLGMTFHQYLVEVRMAKARQLLLSPHRRISEVACAVGYASADQFRHAFKAHAGVPPSQWR
jgi:AraC-like DNA-binding protein